MVSSLTFLQECMHRYNNLSYVQDAARVLPQWFMNYNSFSNLNNTIHYFSKYHDNLDQTEKKLLGQGYAEVDEMDEGEYKKLADRLETTKINISDNSISNTALSLLSLKKQQHKHPLSDEELDDYALRALLPPSESEQAQMKGLSKRFRKMITEDPSAPISPTQREQFKAMTSTEIMITMRGYPDFLDRRSVELLLPTEETSISLSDGDHVSQEFKAQVRMLTDPKCLPSRTQLYKIWPWLNPSWAAPIHPTPPPPLYPITWWYYIENPGRLVYELFTDEYVTELAHYLGRRGLEAGRGKMLRILEIGAGDGRLSHFLRQKFDLLGYYDVEIIPTDTGSWDLEFLLPVARVESTPTALSTYSPDLVLCSWMIPDEDLSALFRKCPSVKEYVLIGPPNANIAGARWETWGIKEDDDPFRDSMHSTPPYIQDGFQRFDLRYLSLFQIAQNYGPYFQFGSRTISYRRKPKGYVFGTLHKHK